MLSGLILAGGRSSRMGRDKAALVLPDGRTLLERQAGLLRAAGATVVFASVRPGFTETRDTIAVHDRVEDAGPLAGIAAGLRAAPGGLVMVVAVDMPRIGPDHLKELLARSTGTCGVVPVLGNRIEPLVAVYPATLATSAEDELGGTSRAVHAWVTSEVKQGRLRLWEAPADWAGVLHSWNTAEDVST